MGLLSIIIGLLALFVVLALGSLFYKRKQNDKILERIDVAEKEVDADARFFITAVYKSGRVELITPQALTEEQVIEKSVEFLNKHNK